MDQTSLERDCGPADDASFTNERPDYMLLSDNGGVVAAFEWFEREYAGARAHPGVKAIGSDVGPRIRNDPW